MRFALLVLLNLSSLMLGPHNANANPSLCKKANLSSFRVRTYSGKFANDDQDYCLLSSEQTPSEINHAILEIISLEEKISAFFAQTYHLKIDRLTSKPIEIFLQGYAAGSLDSSGSFPMLTLGIFEDWSGAPLNASTFVHEFAHLLFNDPAQIVPLNLIKFAKLPLFSEQIPDLLAVALTHKIMGETGFPTCAERAIHGDDLARSFHLPAQNFSASSWIPEMLACCERTKITDASDLHFSEFCQRTKVFTDPGERCSLSSSGKTQGCSVHALSVPITSFLMDLNSQMTHSNFSFYFNAFKKANTTAQLFRSIRSELNTANQNQFDRLWVEFKMDTALAIARKEERHFPALAK